MSLKPVVTQINKDRLFNTNMNAKRIQSYKRFREKEFLGKSRQAVKYAILERELMGDKLNQFIVYGINVETIYT